MKDIKNIDSKGYTLITGATSGIGYELSKAFAAEGFNLIIHGRNEEKLLKLKEYLIENYKIEVEYVVSNLLNPKDVDKIYEFVEKNHLPVDNFINNAGIGTFGYFDGIDMQEDLNLIEINITAFTKLLKLFVPYMKKQGFGRILNVASTAAFTPGPKMAVYYGSKAYVLSVSEALRTELKESNIIVSTLCPGPTATEFQRKAKIKKSDKAKVTIISPELVAKIALKEMMKGKAVIIPGWKNKLLIMGNNFLPTSITNKIILKTNKG